MIKKIKWNSIILMLSLWVIASFNAMAQNQINVRGTVTDDFGGLAGVNIIIKGTLAGTVTDLNGAYEITAAPGAVLGDIRGNNTTRHHDWCRCGDSATV